MNLKDAGIYDLVNIFKGEPTSAHKASAQGGIINNRPRVINIPAYQRPYRWTKDNINRLFLDYDENNAESEYFLGSAVVVEKEKNGIIEFDVIDGQQRLTTLFLLNYIRFLLKREYVLDKIQKTAQLKSSEYCNGLKDCYVDLVGKNSGPFDCILEKINELSEDEEMDPYERAQKITDCYKDALCIPQEKSTDAETLKERLAKAYSFFENEQLCLKYSRSRYDDVLRAALCSVYLQKDSGTYHYRLEAYEKISDADSGKNEFSNNYIDAMKTIFHAIWERAEKKIGKEGTTNGIAICEKAIAYADEVVRNLSLCVVLTENENDANKLFEVLNDRALEVEDLELIKNHFYKEYCTKSGDDETTKDSNISKLDELWADTVFSGNSESNRFISYLSTVYLTGNADLAYKDGVKLKNAIEMGYSNVFYPSNCGGKKYGYNCILSDFNVYYANKIIMDCFGVKTRRTAEKSLTAEQEEKSITYKTIHLLMALGYHAVIPALTNVIISVYKSKDPNAFVSPSFGKDFEEYVKKIIGDKKHECQDLSLVHRCAFVLWISAIKAKDYTIPRNIAKSIIEKYRHGHISTESIDFKGEQISALDAEFNSWIDAWTFSSAKSFHIKVLLLNLLRSDRKIENGNTTILPSVLTYTLDAADLQLDHLEPDKVNDANAKMYFLSEDREQRSKIINSYIGNFMVLDAKENNHKNNVPLSMALGYYKKIEKSWLIEDIKGMISDNSYFDLSAGIPREEFFKERTRRLKEYFKAFLGRTFNQVEIHVNI